MKGHSYIIDLPPNMKMSNVFHADRLRKDPENPLPGQNSEPEEPILINGEPEYEIDKILASRIHYGRLQYKVNWVGHDPDDTWYNADGFIGAPHKIKAFHDERPHDAGPPVRLLQWLEAYHKDVDLEPSEEDNKAEKDGRARRTRRA
jgi:hypothetical protein